MASDDQGEKTEQPTQRRREEARREGQVAYSAELTGSLLLLCGILLLWLFTDHFSGNLKGAMRLFLMNSYAPIEHVTLETVIRRLLSTILTVLGGFMSFIFCVALLVSAAQAGFGISLEAINVKWNKIDPLKGVQRVLSLQGLMKGVQQILKVGMVAGVAYWVVSGRTSEIASMSHLPLMGSVITTWNLAIQLLLAATIILLMLGIADYAFQKYRHEQQLMMSTSEVKDENRNEQGDPQVRGRRRQIQRELALKERMIREVPEATVVITNPTHLAIALKYDRNETPAPICMAKGKGHFAKRIVATAREHGIPVLERKPLAQVLFKTVNVGDEIPPVLYLAVSEILAYLFRLRSQNAA